MALSEIYLRCPSSLDVIRQVVWRNINGWPYLSDDFDIIRKVTRKKGPVFVICEW